MSDWKPKRFWKTAEVAEAGEGWTVTLDGRAVKTPAKSLLVVPSEALAARIAAEWDAQDKEVDPLTMPFTRSANAALDKVTVQHAEVAELIAAYGDADLLCYRAEGPEELIARQAKAWDPLLDWAAGRLDARLTPVTGVIHQGQDPVALAALTARVTQMDAFTLTGFHDLVGISGSLVLGFAVLHDHLPASEAWRLSRIDETWQEEQWGVDDEAQQMAAKKESAFLHAKSFLDLARTR